MKIQTQFLKTLAFALLISVTAVAEAANKAGQILFSRGVVSIIDASDSRRGVRTGADIYEGERLVTGRNGIVQLHLTDGTLIGLRGNSEYLIKRQRYGDTAEVEESEEEESLADQAGELFSGWMRMVTGAIGKSNPANVQQSTQVATIGIRGTVFQVIHVPEDGLPGYPDTDPGTYLMLEEGEVEIAGEGGSRIVRPGEVVFVPFEGAVPRPAPNKRDLFFNEDAETDTYTDVEDYDGELDIAELSDDLNDTVTERLPTDVLPPFEHLGMINVYNGGDFGGADGDSLETVGSGSSRYPVKAFADNSEVSSQLEVLEGERPNDQGYYLLTGQGTTPASEVFWGWFDDAQYERFDEFGSPLPVNGDWHYMLASQVLYDIAEINSRFPAGQFLYTFVGGTPLLGDGGSVLLIDTGTARVDLLRADVFFNLALSGSASYSLVGTGGLGAFLDGNGIILSGTGISGNITGGFAGNGLEGLISAISLTDSGGENFQGTALFEQESGSAENAPKSGLSATSAGFADVFGQATNQTVDTAGSGENRVLTSIFNDYGLEGNDEIRINDGATPITVGGVELKDGTWINWGAWDETDYNFFSNGLVGSPPQNEWLYVFGDYLIPEAVVTDASSSLQGTYTYSLAGGTPLFDAVGSGDTVEVLRADMVVDLSSGEMFVKISVDAPNLTSLENASIAFISDFYGSGVGLLDFDSGVGTGNLTGAFFGDGAAGAGGFLTVNDGTNDYQGTLGFVRSERAGESVSGFFDGEGFPVNYWVQFVGFTTEGEGADRVLLDVFYDDGEVQYDAAATPGAEPIVTGYRELADGTEVNWGIWDQDSYRIAGGSVAANLDWHYMLADNAILNAFDVTNVASSAGLAGEFAYNFAGGTVLQGENNALNVANITGGLFQVDLSTGAITDFFMNTDSVAIGNFTTSATSPTISDLYFNTFAIDSSVLGVSGNMGGYAVGTGVEGLVTNITISDINNNENYFGTALFERGETPVVPPLTP